MNEAYVPKRYIFNIDQVLDDYNTHDGITILGLLEVAVITINKRYQLIDEVIVQSDNAKTYQNHFVKLGIELLIMILFNKIYVKECINYETQDRKALIDAHFFMSTRQLPLFMKKWRASIMTRIQTFKRTNLYFVIQW